LIAFFIQFPITFGKVAIEGSVEVVMGAAVGMRDKVVMEAITKMTEGTVKVVMEAVVRMAECTSLGKATKYRSGFPTSTRLSLYFAYLILSSLIAYLNCQYFT
jgi:hypothetical protein